MNDAERLQSLAKRIAEWNKGSPLVENELASSYCYYCDNAQRCNHDPNNWRIDIVRHDKDCPWVTANDVLGRTLPEGHTVAD